MQINRQSRTINTDNDIVSIKLTENELRDATIEYLVKNGDGIKGLKKDIKREIFYSLNEILKKIDYLDRDFYSFRNEIREVLYDGIPLKNKDID